MSASMRREAVTASASGRLARLCGAVLLAAALVCLADARAQTPAPTAEEVKAAYIHKLPGYVEWPPEAFASAEAPLVIATFGTSDVARHLTADSAKVAASGRHIVVRRLQRLGPNDEVHILFVADDAWRAAAGQLAAYVGRPVLVVAESAGALDDGAMLNFVLHEGRVRFELAPRTAEQHGLRLSSRLMVVAHRVVRPSP